MSTTLLWCCLCFNLIQFVILENLFGRGTVKGVKGITKGSDVETFSKVFCTFVVSLPKVFTTNSAKTLTDTNQLLASQTFPCQRGMNSNWNLHSCLVSALMEFSAYGRRALSWLVRVLFLEEGKEKYFLLLINTVNRICY